MHVLKFIYWKKSCSISFTIENIFLLVTGVRTFCPRPVAKMLENIGGASALLGLVAMATDVEELYAAVKALVCVVKSNKSILKDMERISGYQVYIQIYITVIIVKVIHVHEGKKRCSSYCVPKN